MIQYQKAPDLDGKIREIVEKLGFEHIDASRVRCIRSVGSESRYTLARCHVLPKIMQKALDLNAHYVIEIISEKFDKMSREDQTKTLIHELLHIPRSFGGGFRHHRPYVNKSIVEKEYRRFVERLV